MEIRSAAALTYRRVGGALGSAAHLETSLRFRGGGTGGRGQPQATKLLHRDRALQI